MRLFGRVLFLGLCMAGWTTAASAAWYDSNYRYKQRLVINHLNVNGGTHANFPVLVTEANVAQVFFTHVQKSTPSNIDIIFTNEAENTQLDREVVVFNAALSKFVAWVKIPALSGTADTVIYVYYGYASANRPNDTSTWSYGFAAVWHLTEISGTTALDSTGRGNNGTYNGTLPNAAFNAGKFGNCQVMNGSSDCVNCGNTTDLNINGANPLMLEAWIYFSVLDVNVYQDFLCKGDHQYNLQKIAGGGTNHFNFAIYNPSGPNWQESQSSFNAVTNTWYHAVGRYTHTTSEIVSFINGAKQTASSVGSIPSTTQPVYLGRNSEFTNRYLNGRMQEARIHSVVRSDGWVQTSYASQNDPSAFFTGVGTEEWVRTPTPSVTRTATRTATRTITWTATPTSTRSATVTPSRTSTITPTRTPTTTITLTRTSTPTPTLTPTLTLTVTASATQTYTLTATITRTPPATPTPTPLRLGPEEVIVYPSPVKGGTAWFAYQVCEPTSISIRIYNVVGEVIETLQDRQNGPGQGRTRWDVSRTAPGVYFYRIRFENARETRELPLRKLVVVK